MINENVSFESRFRFKNVSESDMQQEVSNLNSKKHAFRNISIKLLETSSDIYNAVLRNVWTSEILVKQYFSVI